VSSIPYADADPLCRAAGERPDGLLLLVDGVTDPGNLGAILRTAAAAGAAGVILAAEATAGLSPAVAKASAGAVERIPVARESKLAQRLGALKTRGFHAIGLHTRGRRSWDSVDLRGRLAVVLGAEGRGLRPSLARECDIRVAIPLCGTVESLNVAVAAGVLLFEAVRQRREASPGP
jgi:23S rRNA (guanosine2251-2'-O)-methyltransferase